MNTKDILLESASGFMMPFEASEEEEVQVSLGFGEQTHPMTGERFHHRGVDFAAHDLPLFALATGTVVASERMPSTRTISSPSMASLR